MKKQVGCLLLAVLLILTSAAAAAEPEETALPASGTKAAETALESTFEDATPEPEPTPEASETPSAAATPLPEPSAETYITVTISKTGGRIERDGLAAEGAVSVLAGEKLSLRVYPDEGYDFVEATFAEAAVSPAAVEGGAALLEFVPAQDGELRIVCQKRQDAVRISFSGSAAVSYAHGDVKGQAAPGDTLSVPAGTLIRFSITTAENERLEGVEFNGAPLAAEPDESGVSFSMTATESGALNVRTARPAEITAILSNCDLLLREGTEWIKALDGKGALGVNSGVRKNFAVQPRDSYVLKTLLVNGEPIAWAEGSSGVCTFALTPQPGATVITAVCEPARENVEGVDAKTGVHYTLPVTQDGQPGSITQDSWISVRPVTSGPAYDQALEASRSYGELLCVYDLTLRNPDGRYEPSTPISVSIPIPDSYKGGRLKVLHETDNAISEIPYRTEEVQGVPCVTILTDSFSLYMLVDAPEDIAVPAMTDSSASAGGGPLGPWIAGGLLAALVIGFLVRRRHRKQAAH